jgi:hypothetical protein
MAHSFGRNTTHASAATSPITVSFTVNQDETLLVLMLVVASATSRAGGSPDYGGVTLTQANTTQKAVTSPEASAELWYLCNPPVGTYNLTIPNTGLLTIWHMIATAKASGGGKSAFDAASGAATTAVDPNAGTHTVSEAGSITFSVVATGAQTWAPTAQTGTVLNNTDDGATGTGRQYQLSSAGSITPGWTFATSDDYGAVAATFKEVPPGSNKNRQAVHVYGDGISVAGIG